ncbi:glycosyltransferase [Flavobacterium xinjiangense]|uniref:Colanic acid/amylovoran biosynthesis glycosyltransferase n=1 Tax=Flavobacterium xinjiangense TaxID=178356 RepID=A0A1M7MVK3_9FLAO|nr:glycosyltransferase [Flavobacterium xinjiangense]SHM95195.1 colanic acid/amylovoran biosynthesis glycosyltransferase [Flavobacterium xinjiangense]
MNKIIFKIEQFPHLSETFILAQIITAIKCGYDVRLLIGELLDFETSKQLDLIKKYEIEEKIIIEDYRIPKNKGIRLLKWFFILVSNFKNIKPIINFHKENTKFSLTWLFQWFYYNQFNEVAIFHVQYGTNSKPLDILKKTGFKPALVVTFHGHDAFFPINGFIPNNGYYNNLFVNGNLITANTPYLADKIIELGCPKELLSIIPVGVDTGFFYPNKEIKMHKTLKLITVGRLDKVKGHHFCIEAVAQLINKGMDVSLTIIGEGSERGNLENLIKQYKLQDKVFMKGRKSQMEVRQELWDHGLYLLPAVALPDGRRETQGLATLEAQACGLPVIAFDSGGVKYTIEDGVSGFVCNEYDIDCMFNKVKLLIEDTEMYAKMSNKAIIFANKNFAQKIIDQKWGGVYSNLCNGKK